MGMPEPTSGVLNVTFNKPGTYNKRSIAWVEVVRTTRMSNAISTIDLAGMAKGVYSVRVSNSTGTTVKRDAELRIELQKMERPPCGPFHFKNPLSRVNQPGSNLHCLEHGCGTCTQL